MNYLRLANVTVPTGNQVTNTITKTLFSDVYNFPANYDNGSNIGRVFQLKGFGYLSTLSASPGNLIFNIELGGVILGTVTIALPVSLSNSGFDVEGIVILCTSGTSGKMSCQGKVTINNGGAALLGSILNIGTGVAGQIAINTQNAGALGISVQFSVASTSNIITLATLLIEEKQ